MKPSLENMNIALVHEWITNVAGAERVLLDLHDIFPNAPIYTAVYYEKNAKAFHGLDIRTSFLQKIPGMKSKRELLVPLIPFAFEQFDLSQYDLVISSTTVGAKGVITKPETIHISYCHTPTRYIWEPSVDPRALKGRFSSLRKKMVHNMRIWDRVAADRVDYFIANSHYVARRIKKFYRRDSTVIYPGVDFDCYLPTTKEKIKDYFLFVSRLVDYKKCDIVVDAFNELGLPLKIIGRGPEKEKLKNRAKNNIEFLGYLPDSEVKKYYAEAKAFVFAAMEDFGIVPVEAMSAGRPVICYSEGGTAETVEDGVTGLYFHEQTKESLIAAIKKFNVEDYDTKKIRSHAENFSRKIFKAKILEYVNSVIEKAT